MRIGLSSRASVGLLVLLLGSTGPHRAHGGGDLYAAMRPALSQALGASTASGLDPAARLLRQEPTPDLETESPESELLEEVPRDPHASRVELERLAFEPAQVQRLGSFRSIQVNVDAEGNNIRGDAANEPSIAINPRDPSQVVIGWRQFDSVSSDFREAGYSRSSDGGAHWAAVKVLEEGVFRSDPVLDADADGTFHYLSLTIADGFFRTDLFRSRDGGATWLPPVFAQGGDKQWMVADKTDGPGRGNLYEAWNSMFNCCGGRVDFTRSLDKGDSFEGSISIPAPNKMRWGTLDVGPDGTVYMAGVLNALGLGTGHAFSRSTNAWKTGEFPVFDHFQRLFLGGETLARARVNPIGLIGQVWIAVDRSTGPQSGNLYILATIGLPSDEDNDLDVVFLRSTDRGVTWSTPKRLHDDPPEGGAKQWFGTMSVAPNGRIDVIWNDTRKDIDRLASQVYFTFSTDGGVTWSPNHPVTPVFNPTLGYPRQLKIGDYYHMVSDDTGANLAYSATFGGEQNVWFLRIPVDCNGNGVEDACEISCSEPDTHCQVPGCGTGSDADDNGVLDACENRAPSAAAGPDQIVECAFAGGASVTLDGSSSADPDGGGLSYEWKDEQGRTLGNGASLTIPLPLGSHTLTLEVSDGAGSRASDAVEVLVRDTLPPRIECEPASGTASGKGPAPAAGFFFLAATDVCSGASSVSVTDEQGSGPFGPFRSGTILKITKTPGGKAGFTPPGSSSSGLGSRILNLHLPYDPELVATDASANTASIRCPLPPSH